MKETRKRLEDRLVEIQPILDEGEQIKALLKTMDDVDAGPVPHGEGERMSVASRNLQILEFIRVHDGARNRDLAEALDLTPGRIAQLLKVLMADGRVARTNGKLLLTDDGVASMIDVSSEAVGIND